MTRIGPFDVIRPLGVGGMAETLLARRPGGELVVLKRPLTRSAELESQLRDEARAGARLSHPSLVETKGMMITHDGTSVLVLGYIPGVPLDTLIRNGKSRTPVVLRIGRQIAEALAVIHDATDEDGYALGMVHRDVSPSNIILGLDGDARLIDLGIVRSRETPEDRTEKGFLRGKVRYLAPELFHEPRYTPQTDLWALGVTLLELALGRSAVRGGRAEAVKNILSGRVLDLDHGEALDPRLLRALTRLLDPNPAARFGHARDVAALFAMLEKDFGDTRSVACASLPALSLEALALLPRGDAPPDETDARPLTPSSIPAVIGALEDDPSSSEATTEVPRRPSGLAAVVSSWVTHHHVSPAAQLQHYVQVLRGFEAAPFVT